MAIRKRKIFNLEFTANFLRNLIYGTILVVVSLLVIANDNDPTIKSSILGIFAGSLAIYVTHLYADAMAERLIVQKSLSRKQFGDVCKQSLAIFVPTLIPILCLLLALSGIFGIYMALLLGLISCLLILVVVSILSIKLEKLGVFRSILLIGANLIICILVIALKSITGH